MVNTLQFSGSTYIQDMTKSHTFSAKNQGSTYTPIRLIRREIRYVSYSLQTLVFRGREPAAKEIRQLHWRLQFNTIFTLLYHTFNKT